MVDGWKCPNCGKAHGPHVDTCPDGNPGFTPYPQREDIRELGQFDYWNTPMKCGCRPGQACLNTACPHRVIITCWNGTEVSGAH